MPASKKGVLERDKTHPVYNKIEYNLLHIILGHFENGREFEYILYKWRIRRSHGRSCQLNRRLRPCSVFITLRSKFDLFRASPRYKITIAGRRIESVACARADTGAFKFRIQLLVAPWQLQLQKQLPTRTPLQPLPGRATVPNSPD